MKMKMMHLSNGNKKFHVKTLYETQVPLFVTTIRYRYDRFKNSEKTEEGDVSENDAEKDVDNKTDATEQNGTVSNT